MSPQKRQFDVIYKPVLHSSAMKRLDQALRTVAPKEVTLTFIGESGVGKDILARRAHELSARCRGPFIPINCAAIPEALFESELFGHERGAFTGANERVKGKIEAANTGTLFLDEVGEMPLLMQAKILRFLENHRFMRVGGTVKIDADVRLIFATLRPLEQDVQAGRFRSDLFYRIQGVTLRVPPLRERRADIAPLVKLFLSQLSSRHGIKPPRFSRQAKALLLQSDWPGNVRELRNVLETVCLLREGRQVRTTDLPESVRGRPVEQPARPGSRLTLDLDDGLDAMVQRIVETVLERSGGDTKEAAARLRISVRSVQRYIASGRIRSPATPRRSR